MLFLLLASFSTLAAAMPSYIAMPADQIAFVDLTRLHLRRVPRQTLEPPPPPPQLPQALYQQQDYQPIEYIPERQRQALSQEYQPINYLPVQQQTQALNQDYQAIPISYGGQPIPIIQAPPQKPVEVVQNQNEDASSSASQFESRPPDFGEYVDFGAHTGDNGAFGWYADYPINNHEDSYRK